MASLQGKVIAITGAASGIGLALSKQCAAQGASLALADIQEDALNKAATDLQSLGATVMVTKLDVSHSASVDSWIENIMKRFGRLDGAANLAGVEGDKRGVFTNLVDLEDETWRFILSVNLTGLFYCLRAQLRVMKENASIVNAASIAGLMGRPGIGAYSVSKHGVIGLTRTAAKEAGQRGIRVNAVAPGPVQTPMLSRILADAGDEDHPVVQTYDNLPLKRVGTAEEVAKTFLFLLSDDSSWTTGAVYSVDGGVFC